MYVAFNQQCEVSSPMVSSIDLQNIQLDYLLAESNCVIKLTWITHAAMLLHTFYGINSPDTAQTRNHQVTTMLTPLRMSEFQE